MEKRSFNVPQDVMVRLLEKEKKSFIANFGKGYGLQTDEILQLGFQLLPGEKEREKFLLEMPFNDKSNPSEIIDIIKLLDEFIKSDIVDDLLIRKGYLHWLKVFNRQGSMNRGSHLLQTDWNEVYENGQHDYQKGKSVDTSFQEILQTGHLDILEEHENWKALSELNNSEAAKILLKHHRYADMLNSEQECCYRLLYENGQRELIKGHLLSSKDAYKQCHFNVIEFLLERKDWDILSESPFYRQYALRSKLWFLLLYRESKGLSTERMWKFLSDNAVFSCDAYRDGIAEYWSNKNYWSYYYPKVMPKVFDNCEAVSPYRCCSMEAFQIWVFKNIRNSDYKKAILKEYSLISKIRRKMTDAKFPTKLAEIEKALNS